MEPRPPVRYRFGPFLLSPRQRSLACDGRDVALIPRYFDLLVLLVRRRQDAVHRSDIFSTVWADVIVSDGALTQAIRALRRALGDDPRDPTFIRTLSRHGYRFVHANVVEETDAAEPPPAAIAGTTAPPERAQESPVPPTTSGDSAEETVDRLVARLLAEDVTEDERRDAAEQLHAIGTARAVARLGSGPGVARARAMLRDARWDVPGAGEVPLWGAPRGMARGGGAGGRPRAPCVAAGRRTLVVGGSRGVGGRPRHRSQSAGWSCGGCRVRAPRPPRPRCWGCSARSPGPWPGPESARASLLPRPSRGRSDAAALVACGGLAGLFVGTVGLGLALWTLEGLFGVAMGPVGGPVQGTVIGTACGAGYAWATLEVREGLAAPRGRARLLAGARVAVCCAAAALVLAATERPMVGGLVNEIARATRTSSLALTPIARAVGEPEFGRVTAGLVGAVEGAAFGLGLALGLTRRPRSRD